MFANNFIDILTSKTTTFIYPSSKYKPFLFYLFSNGFRLLNLLTNIGFY